MNMQDLGGMGLAPDRWVEEGISLWLSEMGDKGLTPSVSSTRLLPPSCSGDPPICVLFTIAS
jgi:hypothetical protein